jgi:hypothetical protein
MLIALILLSGLAVHLKGLFLFRQLNASANLWLAEKE